MIKWNCAFNIPDSTIQVAEAFIKVDSFKNVNSNSTVKFIMIAEEKTMLGDDMFDIIIKSYERSFNRNFSNEDEIYLEELSNYENAEIV